MRSGLILAGRRRVRAAMMVLAVGASVLVTAGTTTPAAAQVVKPFDLFDGSAQADDPVNAYLLSVLSHYVYEPNLDALVAATPAYSDLVGKSFADQAEAVFADWGLEASTFRFIFDPITDTEGIAMETDDAVVVAMRGTEPPGGFDDTLLSFLADLGIDIASANPNAEGIGAGFALAADAVVAQVRVAVTAAGSDKGVWMTGHSLGGSLAQVLALRLEAPSDASIDAVAVSGVVTFGAAQTFGLDPVCLLLGPCAASVFDVEIGSNAQRWVNNNDPVPTALGGLGALAVPPEFFLFVGDPVHIEHDFFGTGACSLDDATPLLGLDLTLGDHDTGRYATRVFNLALTDAQQLELLTSVPALPPPEPVDEVAPCDEFEFPDLTPPDITPSVTGTVGNGGWYTSDVEISWSVVDDQSAASLVTAGCDTTLVDSDTGGVTFTCEATSDGGSSSAAVTVKRDATPPQASAAASRAPNAAGWYNESFEVAWSGFDLTSGISGCDPSVTYSGPDTMTGSLTGTCTDNAGNQSTPAAYAFAYDATAPMIEIASPLEGADYLQNQIVSASYSCVDGLSGIVSCSGTVADTEAIETSAFGVHPFAVAATDAAGNLASLTHSYSVTFSLGGGFLPPTADAGTSVRAGSTLPAKWVVENAAGEPVEDQADRFELRWSEPVACDDPGDPIIDVLQPAIDVVWSDDDPAQPGQYRALARTERSEAGSCRYLVLDAGGGASAGLLVELR